MNQRRDPSKIRVPTALHAQAAAKHRGPVYKSEPPKFQVTLNQYNREIVSTIVGEIEEELNSRTDAVDAPSTNAEVRFCLHEAETELLFCGGLTDL